MAEIIDLEDFFNSKRTTWRIRFAPYEFAVLPSDFESEEEYLVKMREFYELLQQFQAHSTEFDEFLKSLEGEDLELDLFEEEQERFGKPKPVYFMVDPRYFEFEEDFLACRSEAARITGTQIK